MTRMRVGFLETNNVTRRGFLVLDIDDTGDAYEEDIAHDALHDMSSAELNERAEEWTTTYSSYDIEVESAEELS